MDDLSLLIVSQRSPENKRSSSSIQPIFDSARSTGRQTKKAKLSTVSSVMTPIRKSSRIKNPSGLSALCPNVPTHRRRSKLQEDPVYGPKLLRETYVKNPSDLWQPG